ncbi:MAG: hypothetical protein WA949_19900 [Phormidesmis sp.]
MVKASGQIEKELGLLQQRTEDMAIALDPIYDGYLSALAEASKRQLMSAVHHLCTQAYPDKFLRLSWKERSELQKALQVLAAQIRSQLQEQRELTKKKSRRPQRNSGLDFLHRLLESRSSGAIIQASDSSSEDLLEKLSALAQSNHRLDQQLDQDTDQPKSGRSSNLDLSKLKESDSDEPDSDESDNTEDWEEDIPTAEEYSESESDGNESLFVRSGRGENRSFRAVDLEDMNFPELVEGSDDDSDDDLADLAEDDLTEADLTEDDLTEDDLAEDDLDFEMEVPPAEQRLTISDEEDLLSALEGLARHSAAVEKGSDDDVEQPLAPIHLFKQQMLMEKAIRDVFKTVSDEVNELLQKANVMPSFPKALLAAATDPQGIGEPVNAVPNVVRVSVRVMHGDLQNAEEDTKGDSEEMRDRNSESSGLRRDRRRRSQQNRDRAQPPRSKSNRSHPSRRSMPHEIVEIETLPELAAINLQLSEVAFTDPTVSAWRTRLRKELSTLKRLGDRYTKTQRSLETAQAEDAWRSSWMAPEED